MLSNLEGASSALLINKNLSTNIPSGNIIRQGCPLSPFLYSGITEVLMEIIDTLVKEGKIQGIVSPDGASSMA